MRLSIRVDTWSYAAPLLTRNLNDFISTLQMELENIPPQYREDAAISIESDETGSTNIEICYYRHETDEEQKEREEKEAWETRRKQNERATNAKYQQYLELKKLFEDS